MATAKSKRILPTPENYVGKRLRWAVLLTALLEMPWCALYYGWAPIQYVMKHEGYFIESCRDSQNATLNGSNARFSRSAGFSGSTSNDPCVKQQDQVFNWLFLTADVTNYFTTYLFGLIFDEYGSFAVRILSSICLTGSALLGTIARPGVSGNEFLYYPMMFLLGLGSIPLFVSNLQIERLYSNGPLVISLINGFYDAGDGITIIPKLLYEKLKWPIHYWWNIFLGVNVFIVIRSIFLMPRYYFRERTETSKKPTDTEQILLSAAQPTESSDSTQRHPKSTKNVKISNSEVFKHVFTYQFWLFMPWFIVMDQRAKFFLQASNPWLNWLGGDDDHFTSKQTDIFSILQVTAFVCASFSGIVCSLSKSWCRRRGVKHELTAVRYGIFLLMASVGGLTALYSYMASIKSTDTTLVVVEFVLCIFTRTNMYTVWNLYLLNEFPPAIFGRMCGVTVFFAGIFGVMQQFLLRIAQNDMWPQVQNGFALASIVVTVATCVAYWRYLQAKLREVNSEDENEQ